MKTVTLNTQQGYSVVVPASLSSITTYVLLEQERWFESEIDFVNRYFGRGMTAIDIGANLGAYALLLARRGGPEGRVYAYEPGTEARGCLQGSQRENELGQLTILPLALSNQAGRLWLTSGASSELNTLVASVDEAKGEPVDVSTLDDELKRHEWSDVDFIKIDAEGQEARIVVGGRQFFSQQSPLVMYEVVDQGEANHQLRWMFELLGYDTYRLSGDRSYLVRVGDDETSLGELNYFAAKPSRAAKLAQAGLLVGTVDPHGLSESEREEALRAFLEQPFAVELGIGRDDFAPANAYLEALLAYAAYLYLDWPADRKDAALRFAYAELSEISKGCTSLSRISTFVRVAESCLYRAVAIPGLTWLGEQWESSSGATLEEPFFPPSASFERLPIGEQTQTWFVAAVLDGLLRMSRYSGVFGGLDLKAINWLADSGYANAETKRRLCLKLLGEKGCLGAAVIDAATGSLNPAYWADGAAKLQELRMG